MDQIDQRIALIEIEFRKKKHQCEMLKSFYKEFWNITRDYIEKLKKLTPIMQNISSKISERERP